MRRRLVSIFMLLLGAFAAQAAFAAPQKVDLYCQYDGVFQDPGIPWDNFSTDSGRQYGATVDVDSSLTFTTHPSNGWEIAKWFCGEWPHPQTEITSAAGKSSYTWNVAEHSNLTRPALCMTFEPITYDLSFAGGGGSGSMQPNPMSGICYTNVFELPSCEFTRTGWAFSCWSNSVNGALFEDRATVSGEILCISNADKTATLTALWTNCLYTLTFDANGAGATFADGSTKSNVVVSYGMTFHDALGGPLPTPTWDGMKRNGWWSEESGETESTRITEDTKYTWDRDKTVYMLWEKADLFRIKTVASPDEGGSVSGDGEYELGAEVTVSATANDGYSFRDWSDGGAATHKITVKGAETYTATFTGNVYRVRFDFEDETIRGTLPASRYFTYGSKYGKLEDAVPDDPDLKFDCWVDDEGHVITADSKMLIDRAAYLHARVSVRPSYWVSFAGGPDATGEMDVQKICRDEETALTSNAFVRTGYTFLGWAETNDLAKVKYEDGTNVLNIAAADETNELHAVWQPIAYTVAFDGNGATEIAMEPVDGIYGEEWNLPPNTYGRGELWSFGGWSNEVDGTVFADGATVSNLCTTAGGTNTLHAVWRSNLTDLSRAMHCDNLIWISSPGSKLATPNPWIAHVDVSAGYNLSGSDAQADSKKISGLRFATDYLTATGMVSGTLSFYWKASSDSAKLNLYGENESLTSFSVTGAWNYAEWTVILPAGKTYQLMKLRLENTKESDEDPADRVNIDQMTWTPKGSEPTDADKVTISSAAVLDGKFKLSFASDERFDYNLLTNANLLIDSWGVMTNEVGTGGTIIFAPKIIEGQQQLFYKVETIQRK